MSYERDEAMRQQEATEAMIQMREPRRSGPHPDPIAGAMAEIRNALRLALQFAEDEIENRESAGGDMSDYINEAQDVADTCRAALKAATDLGA